MVGAVVRAAAALAVGLLTACAAPQPAAERTAVDVAADGYVYGYAPVTLARTRANMLCLLPVNQLHHQSATADPTSRVVVAPNVDTLYSIAWLDLRGGPVLLTHPDMGARYVDFQFLDIYTDVFANVGTRTTGAAAGAHVVVPPGWDGPLPPDAAVVESPTWDAWMIGRTLVESATDLEAARALQRQYSLTVLTAPVAEAPPPLPPTACGSNPDPQALAASGPQFFDELSAILAANPPPPADAPLLDELADLGVRPGARPSAGSADTVAALATGVVRGERRIRDLVDSDRQSGQVWHSLSTAGRYGTDYLQRAVVATIGLGANVPEESTYHVARVAADGTTLRGETGYLLRFPPGALPPVDDRGFWSVTLYGPDMFLVANPVDRYAVGDRTPGLVRGPDGGLDVWVSSRPPIPAGSNWLPAPPGEFVLMFRSYLPTDRDWVPPEPVPQP
ncbi:DUF1254 domain-containing protein [Rhodococcus rhodochrous]|uniref:DUF1254 domain-containing protein n=1 Tax=Rhodococcus rhodochrous TaxID=1829 RepID=UPI001EE72A2E|nr:DUF1254 domain-containing protein [Rhodococcus rhodochrous]